MNHYSIIIPSHFNNCNGLLYVYAFSSSFPKRSSKLSLSVISCIRWSSCCRRYWRVSNIRSFSYWSMSILIFFVIWAFSFIYYFQILCDLCAPSEYMGIFFLHKGSWSLFSILEIFSESYIYLSVCHLCRLG